MIKHPNGGGMVAETATVAPSAYIGKDCEVLDNAVVGDACIVSEGAVIFGDAVLETESIVEGGARVGGTAFLSATTIHGEKVILLKTPITIHGFEQKIVVAEDFIIIGCQCIMIDEWKTRSLALLRMGGFPKKSAERIRDSIDVVHKCYTSLYHEEDLQKAYQLG
jgi:carbonic anhydrase/acetyltransferase-like protein (isoleucine patch superfamily)